MGWVGGGNRWGANSGLLIISKWLDEGSIRLSAFYSPSFHFAREMNKNF